MWTDTHLWWKDIGQTVTFNAAPHIVAYFSMVILREDTNGGQSR